LGLGSVRELPPLNHLERPKTEKQDREQRQRTHAERADPNIERRSAEEVCLDDREGLRYETRPKRQPRRRGAPAASAPPHRHPLTCRTKTHSQQRPSDGLTTAVTPKHRPILLSELTEAYPAAGGFTEYCANHVGAELKGASLAL
jgi:hypothetical protein